MISLIVLTTIKRLKVFLHWFSVDFKREPVLNDSLILWKAGIKPICGKID